VRVARDHLRVETARDRRQVERALLAPELREEDDLEKEVAQLAFQLAEVLRRERVEGLVALLEEIAREVVPRLLPVPGAFAPQALHQLHQLRRRASRLGGGARVLVVV